MLSRGEYGPGAYTRELMPSWLCSQMCQSCRLVMSQNRTPSSGSSSGRLSESRWNSHSQLMRVRAAPSGQSV